MSHFNPYEGSESYRKRNPHLFSRPASQAVGSVPERPTHNKGDCSGRTRPVLNKTEARFRDILFSRRYHTVLEQAVTLRLDPPFKSYKPDLVAYDGLGLIFFEVKGPHRFREKGIAKAALAAKTYPMFVFMLAEWTGKEWKERLLSS